HAWHHRPRHLALQRSEQFRSCVTSRVFHQLLADAMRIIQALGPSAISVGFSAQYVLEHGLHRVWGAVEPANVAQPWLRGMSTPAAARERSDFAIDTLPRFQKQDNPVTVSDRRVRHRAAAGHMQRGRTQGGSGSLPKATAQTARAAN